MTDDERALLTLTATGLATLLNEQARKIGETSKTARDIVTLLRWVDTVKPELAHAGI